MRNWILFTVPTLIWGSTWLVIKEQLGSVAPEVSVAYRFGVAAVVLLVCCLACDVTVRYSLRTHCALAFLGFCHYAAGYVLLYRAEQALTSGVVAVVFSSAVLWNAFAASRRISLIAYAVLGTLALAILFRSELASQHAGMAVVLTLVAAIASAAGNVVARRLFAAGVAVLPSTAWSMAYGSLAVTLYCVARGVPFRFDGSARYVGSLAYLAVFGSAIAFLAYLELVKRIGASRASYTAFVTPVLALMLTWIFER